MSNETPLGTIEYPERRSTRWFTKDEDGLELWLEQVELLGIPTYATFADVPDPTETNSSTFGGTAQNQLVGVAADKTVYRSNGSDWVAFFGHGTENRRLGDVFRESITATQASVESQPTDGTDVARKTEVDEKTDQTEFDDHSARHESGGSDVLSLLAEQISDFGTSVIDSISGSEIAPAAITDLWNGTNVTANVNNQSVNTEEQQGAAAIGPVEEPAEKVEDDAIVIGDGAAELAGGEGSVVIGAEAIGDDQTGQTNDVIDVVAVGQNAEASNSRATAVGPGGVVASGQHSTAVGRKAESGGLESVALGHEAHAGASQSISLGSDTSTKSSNAIAIGRNAEVGSTGWDGVAIGSGSKSTNNAVAVGRGAEANDYYATVMGRNATSAGESSIAIGEDADVGSNGVSNIAIGHGANVDDTNAIAIGRTATVTGNQGTAIGADTSADVQATALGIGATASASNSIAIGNGVTSATAGGVRIGQSQTAFAAADGGVFADVDLNNEEITFEPDEVNTKVVMKYKDSAGTVRTTDVLTWA